MRALSCLATAIVASASFYALAGQEKPVTPLTSKPSIGDFGLDLTAGNPAVKPGDDFFSYASGTWYKKFEIPPDRSSFGAFVELDELSKQRVREIIEQAAASHPPEGSPAQKIGDYYAAFMDQAAIEAKGLEPAMADLRRIHTAANKTDIAKLFGAPGF